MNFNYLLIIVALIFSYSCGVKKQPKRGEDIVLQSYIDELKSQPEIPEQNKPK